MIYLLYGPEEFIRSEALAALKAAEPEIMRGVGKGIIHKNTGSRKVSRLAHRITALPG